MRSRQLYFAPGLFFYGLSGEPEQGANPQGVDHRAEAAGDGQFLKGHQAAEMEAAVRAT